MDKFQKIPKPDPACQNNKGYGPFEYHIKNILTQWKHWQSLQPNHVLSNNQIFYLNSLYVNFGNGPIFTYLLKPFLFAENLQSRY